MTAELTALQNRILNNSVASDELFYNGTPCWIWIGKTGNNGRYGKINIRLWGRHRTFYAHRVSAHAFKGDPLESDGRVQMHLCNNSRCCSPLHLALGSQSANMNYCVATGRHNSVKEKTDHAYDAT